MPEISVILSSAFSAPPEHEEIERRSSDEAGCEHVTQLVMKMRDTKKEILRLIFNAPRTMKELVEQVSVSPPGVYQHILGLENKNLIFRRREGRSFVNYLNEHFRSTLKELLEEDPDLPVLSDVSNESIQPDRDSVEQAVLSVNTRSKKILFLIFESPCTVEEIAEALSIPHQTSVYPHLRTLQDKSLRLLSRIITSIILLTCLNTVKYRIIRSKKY